MASLNKVLLIGNLTRDPEQRPTGGDPVCLFSIACNERYKSRNSGEMQQKTTFLDVKVWGKRGDGIMQYLKKGDPIFVEGKLETESWDDKTTGAKRSRIVVNASDWQFVSNKSDARSTTGAAPSESRPSNTDNSDFNDEAVFDASQGVPF